MVDTLLMDRVLEAIVSRVAIMCHAARPIQADDILQHIGTASRVDGEERRSAVTDPTVEPDGVPSHAPTGLVRRQILRIPKPFGDLLVCRLQLPPSSKHDLGTRPAGNADAKHLREHRGNFTVRQTGVLVQIDDRGLGIRAELTLRGAGGIADLQLVMAPQMLAAPTAMTAMNVKLANDRLAWNLGLILLVETVLNNVAATAGTLVRQRRFVGLVNLIGRRRRPMAVSAMRFARLAARFLGIGFGFALGKRSGLTLRGLLGGGETSLQVRDGLLEACNRSITLGEMLAKLLQFDKQLFVGLAAHALPRDGQTVSAAQFYAGFQAEVQGTLNKHRNSYEIVTHPKQSLERTLLR